MTEDRLRELFREMRDEPVPPDSQVRVRMAVAARTVSWRRYWKVAALMLVSASVALVVMLNRQPTRIVPPPSPPPVIAEKVERVEAPPAPAIVPVKHRIRKRAMPVAEAATLIRIETPDPDVVILLVGG